MSRAESLNAGNLQSLLLVEKEDQYVLLLKTVVATEL